MQSFVADISAGAIPQILRVKQGDSMSRFFQLTLTDGGAAWQPPEGAVYTVRFATDKSSGWYDTIRLPDGGSRPAVEAQGNRLTVELAMQAAAGNGELCLVINDALGYQLAAWNITIQTEPVPGADSQEAEHYYGILAEQISQAVQSAETAGQSAQAAAQSALQAAQSALEARGHAIQDTDGQAMEQQPALQFVGFALANDPSGKRTIVSPQIAGDSKNVAGYVGEVVFFADEQLRENHVWADGGTIDPAKWPELAAYAASAGWQTDESSGLYKTPDFRGRFLLTQSDSHAVGSSGGEETHKLTTEELPRITGNITTGGGSSGNSAGALRSASGVFTAATEADYAWAKASSPGELPWPSGGPYVNANLDFGKDLPHNNMPPYYTVTAQIRAKVDEITAKVVEVNGNTLAAFEDGQILAQQGGRISGQAGAIKTFVGVSKLGLTSGSVTTAQVFDAMPEGSTVYLNSTNVSDPPDPYGLIIVHKISSARGQATFYRAGDTSKAKIYQMYIKQSVGGLTGKWIPQVADAYQAGDIIKLDSYVFCGGLVSSGATGLYFTIPISKPIVAQKATVSGTYSVRGATSEYYMQNASLTNVSASITPAGVTVTVKPTWQIQPENNLSVNVHLLSATITLS